MDIRKGSINVKNIIGRKVGMTSVFTEDGRSVSVTVIEAGPCTVVQKKTKETDGYEAVALAFGDVKPSRLTKALQGHYKKSGLAPKRDIREFRTGIDGIELCRRLRAHERTWQIPVLAVTGYGDRDYDDRARDAGADHVLIKPCSGDLLVAEARRLLASSQALRNRAHAQIARSEAARARADRALERSAQIKARSSQRFS